MTAQPNRFKALVLISSAVWLAVFQSLGAAVYQLVTVDTPWRYNQTGTNLLTAWTAPNYDDTGPGWKGPSNILFGFETEAFEYLPLTFRTGNGGDFPNPTNVVPYVTNYYFRTHFTMPSAPPGVLAVTALLSSNWVDDGSVVYLNGNELFRFNMPDGTILATTFARTTINTNEPSLHVTNSFSSSLIARDNVLAVELHSAAITDRKSTCLNS